MDLAQQASQKFDNLFMLNKHFQSFVAELRALTQRCKKTEAQKVEALKKKVSKELPDKLAYQPLPPPKDNFDAWCNLCQQLYNNEQEFKHFETLKSGRPTQSQLSHQLQLQGHPPLVQPQHPLPGPLPLPDAGEHMQLDSTRAAARAAARAFCGENNCHGNANESSVAMTYGKTETSGFFYFATFSTFRQLRDQVRVMCGDTWITRRRFSALLVL
jgi:hypothetical protein